MYYDKNETLTSERKSFLVRDKDAASYLQHATLILIPKEVSFLRAIFQHAKNPKIATFPSLSWKDLNKLRED